MKYITFAIPSYNSQDYLHRCVDSLLPGGEDVEIIIVNDGSKDDTAKIADEYALKYPNIVKVIHKENGGHGSGVNSGISNATGVYFKVVDSDDWVDYDSYMSLLSKIKETVDNKVDIDLFLVNFVYNRLEEKKTNPVNYKNIFTPNKITAWNEMGTFKVGQYLIMHALVYKTKVLIDSKLKLPEHTFYVDNIFAYQPFPYVKNIFYLDVDFYQYYIGREDQSVNQKTMVKRIDQQMRVTRIIMNCVDLKEVKKTNAQLAKYLTRYFSIMMTISSVLCSLSKDEAEKQQRRLLWEELKKKDIQLYNNIRYRSINVHMVMPEPISDAVAIKAYHFARKKFMFA